MQKIRNCAVLLTENVKSALPFRLVEAEFQGMAH